MNALAAKLYPCKACGRMKPIDVWCDCPSAVEARERYEAGHIGYIMPATVSARAPQWRCRRCNRLLAIGVFAEGSHVTIKCKCNQENDLP